VDSFYESGSEPAEYWSVWIEHDGGECPVPGHMMVASEQDDGCIIYMKAADTHWHRVVRYRYLATDHDLFLTIPEGWTIPAAAMPFEWKPHPSGLVRRADDDGLLQVARDCATHYRPLPRE
jgi:hypothetical protein